MTETKKAPARKPSVAGEAKGMDKRDLMAILTAVLMTKGSNANVALETANYIVSKTHEPA